MTKKAQIHMRIEEDLFAKLKQLAKEQNRSMNNLLEYIIDEYLNHSN